MFGKINCCLICKTDATDSIAPDAAKQCPICDFNELIKGKLCPCKHKAFVQFSISKLSFDVAVKCPLMASISEPFILAYNNASVIHF